MNTANSTTRSRLAGRSPRSGGRPRSRGLVIGHLAGAPVVLTPSWLLGALVLTVVFAPNVRRAAPNFGTAGVIGVAFGFALLLALSVFLHEAAHALVATRQGQKVHELAVTLWGGHTAFSNQLKGPGAAALVAIVGPITNLLLAGIFYAAYQLLPVGSLVALLCYAAFFSNAFVGLFNLLPGLPLDGGQILEAIVWGATGWRTRGTIVAGWFGRIVAVGVILWALVWPLIQGRSINLTSALWLFMIATFLWHGSGQSIGFAKRNERISGYSARSLLTPTISLPVGASAADASLALAHATDRAAIPALVSEQGQPIGWVDAEALARVPEFAAARTPVTTTLVPFPEKSAVPITLAGLPLLSHLDATSGGARLVPVVDDAGRLAGVIDIGQLATELARLRAAR